MINKIMKKGSVWFSVLKQYGILEFMIMGLQFMQKHGHSKRRKKTSLDKIHTKARYEDIIVSRLVNNPKHYKSSNRKKLQFAWIMPPPGKGSGGHLNIFRFIEFLENAGHECSIYLYADGKHGTIDAVKTIMGDSYPDIMAAKSMKWFAANQDLDDVDGIFATSWETAYASFASKSPAKRFYFIQDFEPYFYPMGGMYSLAENTYKMGFYGITAGGWLKKKLSTEYGMRADSFNFGSDGEVYKYTNKEPRKEILCYVRPYTARRGFEMAIIALDIFHKMHPDCVINLVGYDVSEYDIPFPYKNLKILEISQLSSLYNKCSAGLVLSYTNMSLLPLELLRCGTIPVLNDGENNRLVSNNPFIVYSQNDPYSIANKISEAITRKDIVTYSKKASASVTDSNWNKSGLKFVDIVEREMRNNE
jgi:glycosyltransferase involved in cell wall biosynthesis